MICTMHERIASMISSKHEILWSVLCKKWGFNRETAHFFFFLHGFSETRSIEIGGFTCFWGKNLKPVVVSLKPEILAKPKFSGFNETHHGVSSFYPQITREITNFRLTEFHWIPCQKIKKRWARFLWNHSLAILAHILALNTSNFSAISFKKIWAIPPEQYSYYFNLLLYWFTFTDETIIW